MVSLCLVTSVAVFTLGMFLGAPPACSRRTHGFVTEPQRGSAPDYWPSSVGHLWSHGNSQHAGPKNLTAAYSWNWSHPLGRFRTPGNGGVVMDSEKNLYLSASFETIKFSPDGRMLWRFGHTAHCIDQNPGVGLIMNSLSLWGDAVIGSTILGSIFALDKESGRELWSTQFGHRRPPGTENNGFVQVAEGVVVVDCFWKVHGFNVTDGAELWMLATEIPLWNFLATFPGDGTVVFQDYAGTVYRCRLIDGTVLWKAGGIPGSWSDGSAVVGMNGVVYAVNNFLWPPSARPPFADAGAVRAHRLSDGEMLWERRMQSSVNVVPAVGRLAPGANLSVVQAIGDQDRQGAVYHVIALDALTGTTQWTFEGPSQRGLRQAMSDLTRVQQIVQEVRCVPNPWSAPVIDSTGTVYIASQEGPIFALRDADGDGKVTREETSSYDTLRAFPGSSAPAIGPGLLAIASCDGLHVFRYPA